MKKFFSGILVGLLLAFIFVSVAADSQLKLVINGEDITATAEPIIHNNKTYTPARAVAEALGATVEWDTKTRTVNISKHADGGDEPMEGYLGILEICDKYNVTFVAFENNFYFAPIDDRETVILSIDVKKDSSKNYVLESEFLEAYNAYLESKEE